MRTLALIVSSLLMGLACGPLVMIPGGELSGRLADAPASWAFTDDVDVVQLETRPEEPYSVNVWTIATAGNLYVVAGYGEETAWAQHIEADPRVRLQVEDDVYELRAERTDDDAEVDAFLAAAMKKYDFELEEGQREQAILYRLMPR